MWREMGPPPTPGFAKPQGVQLAGEWTPVNRKTVNVNIEQRFVRFVRFVRTGARFPTFSSVGRMEADLRSPAEPRSKLHRSETKCVPSRRDFEMGSAGASTYRLIGYGSGVGIDVLLPDAGYL